MQKAKNVSIWFQEKLSLEILSRGANRSHIINRDLSRLYDLYRQALRHLRLTTNEACLIVDALNGVLMNADTANLLWAEIEDSIKLNDLDTKWKVDADSFVAKLKAATEMQSMAVIDASERWWEADHRDEKLLKSFFMIKEAHVQVQKV